MNWAQSKLVSGGHYAEITSDCSCLYWSVVLWRMLRLHGGERRERTKSCKCASGCFPQRNRYGPWPAKEHVNRKRWQSQGNLRIYGWKRTKHRQRSGSWCYGRADLGLVGGGWDTD